MNTLTIDHRRYETDMHLTVASEAAPAAYECMTRLLTEIANRRTAIAGRMNDPSPSLLASDTPSDLTDAGAEVMVPSGDHSTMNNTPAWSAAA